jgi:hypothetical protein
MARNFGLDFRQGSGEFTNAQLPFLLYQQHTPQAGFVGQTFIKLQWIH